MKSKLCWIPFIPVTIAVIVLKVCETLNVFPLLPTNTLSYISIGLVLLMFAVNIVFTITDKKTSPAYLLTRNLFAAVCAMLAAVCVASRSALTIILALQNSQFSLSTAVGLFQSVVGVIFLIAANSLAKRMGERGIM